MKSPTAKLADERPIKVEGIERPVYPIGPYNIYQFRFEDQPLINDTPYPLADPEWVSHEILQSLSGLEASIWCGDTLSAKTYVDLARLMCEQIEEMKQFIPGVFDGIAQRSLSWPMAVTPGRAGMRNVERRLESLGVGKMSLFRLAAQGKQPDYFARQPYRLLLRLYNYIVTLQFLRSPDNKGRLPREVPAWLQQCLELPDCNKNTATPWFNSMWTIIMQVTEGQPESRPELKVLGECREYDSELYGAHKNPPRGTRLAKVRNGIKTRLKRDFLKMLATDSA